jgi:TP901 family phage tail tape measure protein
MATASLGTLSARMKAQTAVFTAAMARAKKSVKSFGTAAEGVRNKSAVAFAALGASVGLITKTFANFETRMVKVKAITGATDDQFQALQDTARDWAQKTEFSATQVAEGMQFLAQAGFTAEKTMAAIPQTLKLASVGMMDLAQASDIVTNIMSGMGRTTDQLSDTVDILVSASTGANTNVQQLGEAFKFVGPVARSAGIGFEETTAFLALLGNAGIQASLAGTSLRGSITRLLAPTDKSAAILKKLGISAVTAGGKLKPLDQIIGQLQQSGATTAQIMQVFGLRAGPGMAAQIAVGQKSFEQFVTRLRKSTEGVGAAQNILNDVAKTTAFQFKVLISKFQEATIAIGQELAPTIMALNLGLQAVVDWFNTLSPSVKSAIGHILLGAAAFTAVVAVVATLMTFAPALVAAVGAIGAAFAGAGAIASLAWSPITLIVLGVVAAIAAAITVVGALRRAWASNFGGIQDKVAAVIGFVKNEIAVAGEIVDVVLDSWTIAFGSAFDFIVGAFEIGARAAKKFFDFLVKTNPLVAAVRAVWEENFLGLSDIITNAGKGIVKAWDAVVRFIVDSTKPIAAALDFLGGAAGALAEIALPGAGAAVAAVAGGPGAPTGAPGIGAGAGGDGGGAAAAVKGVVDSFKAGLDLILPSFGELKEDMSSLGDGTKKLQDSLNAGAAAIGEAAIGAEGMGRNITVLKDTVDAFTERRIAQIEFETGIRDALAQKQTAAIEQAQQHAEQMRSQFGLFAVSFGEVMAELQTQLNSNIKPQIMAGAQQFAGGVISSMGEAGVVIQGAMEGFKSGGPIGAIIGAIIAVLLQLETIMEAINLVSEGFGMIFDAISPLFKGIVVVFEKINEVLEPILEQVGKIFDIIGGVLLKFAEPLLKIIGFIGEVLTPIFEVLGAVFEVFGEFMEIIADLGGMFSLVTPILKLLGEAVKFIAGIIKEIAKGISEIGKGIARFFDDVRKELANFLRSIGLGDLANELSPQVAAAVEAPVVDAEPTADAVTDLGAAADDTADAMRDTTESAEALADSVRDVNEEILGVPEGFKRSLARFQAIDPTDGEAAPGGMGMTISITATSVDEVGAMLDERGVFDNIVAGGSGVTTGEFAVERAGS